MMLMRAQGHPAHCPLQLLICSRVIQLSIPSPTKPYRTLPNHTKLHHGILFNPFRTKTKSDNIAPHRIAPGYTKPCKPYHVKPYRTISNHSKAQFTTQIGPQLLICWQVTKERGSCGARLNLEQQRCARHIVCQTAWNRTS